MLAPSAMMLTYPGHVGSGPPRLVVKSFLRLSPVPNRLKVSRVVLTLLGNTLPIQTRNVLLCLQRAVWYCMIIPTFLLGWKFSCCVLEWNTIVPISVSVLWREKQ